MAVTTFNPNEIILEKVLSVIFTDYANGQVIGRLTQLEDANIEVTSEADEILDASGATIDTIRRGKKAKFDASNALFSTDLFAMQMGDKKKVASSGTKIIASNEVILPVDSAKHTITLPHSPKKETLKYIYKFENKGLAEVYTVTSGSATEKQFTLNDKTITLPADVTTGEFYIVYDYETQAGVEITANSESFPQVTGFKAFAKCKSVCDPNVKYKAIIVAKRALLDSSSVQLALKFDGKHPFSVEFNKEYCQENADLFTFIIPQE